MEGKIITISEIAKRLNITPSTVSRALNDNPRISRDTIVKVKELAKKLNYKPNNLAAALRSGRSKIIGIIIPTINRNFFSSVVKGIEDIANRNDFNVIIAQSNDDFIKEQQVVEALLNTKVDGIIASVSKNCPNFDHFQKIIDRKIPLILFDRYTPDIPTSQVVIDDYYAAYTITKSLIEQGCKRIAYFTRAKKISIYNERYRGYADALAANNMAIDTDLIIENDVQLEDGRQAMEQLLKLSARPDAVFSSSDYAAIGALQVIKEHKLSIPKDIALAGFGNEPFTKFTEPALTTVNQMSIEMGTKAANLFFEILEAGYEKFTAQKIVLKPEVIIRASSKKKK
jgi:LacI family transcriptional regulator